MHRTGSNSGNFQTCFSCFYAPVIEETCLVQKYTYHLFAFIFTKISDQSFKHWHEY